MKKEIQWLLKEKYNNNPNKNFKKDVKRLEKGEPIDYVIGFKEFLGCRIDLSKKPLIPRPETEFWAAQTIDEVKTSKSPKPRCLDIFSGSGCVGVAVLANAPNSLCDFSDVEVAQIRINLKNNFVRSNRFKIIKSDIFKKVREKYDFILANPPYIPTKNKKKIQKYVLKYEPKKALFAGKDGLAFIKKFLKDAKRHLNTQGVIYMEFDSPQKNAISKLIKKYRYSKFEFGKDQFDRIRFVRIVD